MKRHPKADMDKFLNDALNHDGDECLNWPFTIKKTNGYGTYLNTTAHRFVLQISTGDIGLGLEAAHDCGNPACVNPRHLRWATHKENMADREVHGTTPKGEVFSSAVISDAQAEDIFGYLKNKEKTQHQLAEEYGISRSVVAKISSGHAWNHVTGLPKKRDSHA